MNLNVLLGFDYYSMTEFDYKNIAPNRRCDDTHLTHQDDNDPDLDDVKTEFLNKGRENGEGNHNLSWSEFYLTHKAGSPIVPRQ